MGWLFRQNTDQVLPRCRWYAHVTHSISGMMSSKGLLQHISARAQWSHRACACFHQAGSTAHALKHDAALPLVTSSRRHHLSCVHSNAILESLNRLSPFLHTSQQTLADTWRVMLLNVLVYFLLMSLTLTSVKWAFMICI